MVYLLLALVVTLAACNKSVTDSEHSGSKISDLENFLAKSLSIDKSQILYNSETKEFLVNSEYIFYYDDVYSRYIAANEYHANENQNK